MKLSYKPTLIERLKLLYGPICYTNKNGETHRDIDDGPAMIFKDSHQYFENGAVNRIESLCYILYFDKNGFIYKKETENKTVHFIPNSNKYFVVGSKDYKMMLSYYLLNNMDITNEVEKWLHERNLCYENLSDEDYLAFCFFIETL